MRRILVLVVLLVVSTTAAHADDLAVGLYAPSAPFAGTSARQDYVSRLAKHLAAASGAKAVGRVYSKSGDFASAVKGGDLDVAVVDATYLAAIGSPYTVLAVATRGGDTSSSWQLISRGGESAIADLKDKKLLCTALGGRESDFVTNAMLGGELPKGFFAKIDTSPDVASLLTALGLGRADAAVVPGGVDLPSGVSRVATLPSVSWPVLVAFTGTGDSVRKQITDAATGFDGGDVLGGFSRGGGDALRSLSRRFGRTERRGPMVTPSVKVTIDELVQARRPAITRLALELLLAPPAPLPPPR